MVKMCNFFAQNEIFQEYWPAQAHLERILVVRYRHTLVGGQHLSGRINPDPVKRLDRGIHPFRRNTAGFVIAVLLGRRAAGRQSRPGFGSWSWLGRNCICKAMLGRFGGAERHGCNQSLSLRQFFHIQVAAQVMADLGRSAVRNAGCGFCTDKDFADGFLDTNRWIGFWHSG